LGLRTTAPARPDSHRRISFQSFSVKLEPADLRRVADDARADHLQKAVAEQQMLTHRDRIAEQAIERCLG